MEVNIDIEKGYFSVTAEISREDVLQEAINNFFKAYFEKHNTTATVEVIANTIENFTTELAKSELGITLRRGQVVVSSRDVARVFGKPHGVILRSIRGLECSNTFLQNNFDSQKYLDSHNHSQPEIFMTRDGFTFLVMGYTGKVAAKFREAYINAFNEMERVLKDRAN